MRNPSLQTRGCKVESYTRMRMPAIDPALGRKKPPTILYVAEFMTDLS
ncbi:hypothetical protein AB4Y85_07125 [Microvirga sp. 2YAF29]